MTKPLVIVGNGMAAARFVEELDARARGRYAIAVIGDEPHLAYNRILLSSLLAEEVSREDVELRTAAWWRDRGVTLVYGCAATEIDRAESRVHLKDGSSIPFEKLVLATGSNPIRLPVAGTELEGVLTFRDLRDVARISEAAGGGRRAVVIGGGLLGLEAAYAMARKRARVTLLHLMPHLMERQLDPRAGGFLRQAVESKGIEVLLEADTAEIEGDKRVSAVRLKDGRRIEADLVVMALGVRPNADLARRAQIGVRRGIVVDDRLATDAEDIFALGECAEHRGICYGLVDPAYEQARVLAEILSGGESEYAGSTLSTNLKVSGVNVFSAGDIAGGEGSEEILLSDPGIGTYKRLVIKDNRLAGAVLVSDTSDGAWYLELIRSARPIGKIRDSLAFGRAFALPEVA